jgi:hypothetical protein
MITDLRRLATLLDPSRELLRFELVVALLGSGD